MSELFRETIFGQAVRFLTGNKVLQYPKGAQVSSCHLDILPRAALRPLAETDNLHEVRIHHLLGLVRK